MRPLVTRVRSRARNWRMSVPAEKSEGLGGGAGGEVGGEVFGVVVWRLGGGGDQGGVAETEVGAGIQNGETATATVGGEMAAAWMIGRAGFSRCEGHFLFLSLERGGAHPPSRQKERVTD